MNRIEPLTIAIFVTTFLPFVSIRCRRFAAVTNKTVSDAVKCLFDAGVLFLVCGLLSWAAQALVAVAGVFLRYSDVAATLRHDPFVPLLVAVLAIGAWRNLSHIEVHPKEQGAIGAFFRDIAVVGSLYALLVSGAFAVIFASMIVLAPSGHSPPMLLSWATLTLVGFLAGSAFLSFSFWRARRSFTLKLRPRHGMLLLRDIALTALALAVLFCLRH